MGGEGRGGQGSAGEGAGRERRRKGREREKLGEGMGEDEGREREWGSPAHYFRLKSCTAAMSIKRYLGVLFLCEYLIVELQCVAIYNFCRVAKFSQIGAVWSKIKSKQVSVLNNNENSRRVQTYAQQLVIHTVIIYRRSDRVERRTKLRPTAQRARRRTHGAEFFHISQRKKFLQTIPRSGSR